LPDRQSRTPQSNAGTDPRVSNVQAWASVALHEGVQRLAESIHNEAHVAKLGVVQKVAAIKDKCRLHHGHKDLLVIQRFELVPFGQDGNAVRARAGLQCMAVCGVSAEKYAVMYVAEYTDCRALTLTTELLAAGLTSTPLVQQSPANGRFSGPGSNAGVPGKQP